MECYVLKKELTLQTLINQVPVVNEITRYKKKLKHSRIIE